MPGVILDWTGKPMQWAGSNGSLYAKSDADERLRPPQGNHFDDYISLLSNQNWRRLVSESRSIGSRGMVAAAMMQKADYVSASHWRPYFTGEDADYGEEMEELLENTRGIVCTRGPRYDWRTFWKLGVLSVAFDGAFFILLTESDGGWPMIQPIEAHRVGQREFGLAEVKPRSAITTTRDASGNTQQINTPYAGLRIANGIIYDKKGNEIAYRVLGQTPEEDEDISARDMIHVGPPRWFSEGRPIPQIAPALLDLLGIDTARSAQLDAQIIHSKLTLIETNETGKRDSTMDLVNPPRSPNSAAGQQPEVIERAQMRFVKKGGGLTAHESKVPSNEWMNYDLRMSAHSIAAAGWRAEMLDPSGLAGAATRGFQDQINTLIGNVFEDFRPATVRVDQYRVSKFAKIGVLRDHPEFLKVDTTPPPDFVVDRNSAKVDVDMVRAGADYMPNVHRRAGLRTRQVIVGQAKYLQMIGEVAAKYGVDKTKLGTTSLPGDANNVDTIGIAVRAGAITPSYEIEDQVRRGLDLPPMGESTRKAWKDAGIRTPITLANAQGAAPLKAGEGSNPNADAQAL